MCRVTRIASLELGELILAPVREPCLQLLPFLGPVARLASRVKRAARVPDHSHLPSSSIHNPINQFPGTSPQLTFASS